MQLLIVGIGRRTFGVPTTAVERILRMAALTPLPDAPAGIAGVLNLQGTVLPVVDPRPRLGASTPTPQVDQYLVSLSAHTRYILWIDSVDRVVEVPSGHLDVVQGGHEQRLASFVATIGSETIPVLSVESLDPGPLMVPSELAR